MLPQPERKPILQTLLSDDELVDLNIAFEREHPREILRWALDAPGLRRIAIASAFQAEGTAVMHMASTIRPDVPICSSRRASSSPRRWPSRSSSPSASG
ncbi:MAG: hypothetical protein ACXWZF_07960 [Actinomycetota bacterium]